MEMWQGEKAAGDEQAGPAARTYNILQPSAAVLVPLLTLCQPEQCTNSIKVHKAAWSQTRYFFPFIFFSAVLLEIHQCKKKKDYSFFLVSIPY